MGILFGICFLLGLAFCGVIAVGLLIKANGEATLRKIEKEQNLPPGSLQP
jgi:hypothetical protein